MRSTGLSLEFLDVPVLLISVASGQLLTFHVLPVTWHADTGIFRDDILHVFHGPLCCWIVLAVSRPINISFSVIVITIIIVIGIFFVCIFCALLYVCCLLHYGANKVSYIGLIHTWRDNVGLQANCEPLYVDQADMRLQQTRKVNMG